MHEINKNILILIMMLKNEISPRYPLSWTVYILRVFSVAKRFGSLYISSNLEFPTRKRQHWQSRQDYEEAETETFASAKFRIDDSEPKVMATQPSGYCMVEGEFIRISQHYVTVDQTEREKTNDPPGNVLLFCKCHTPVSS